jgi:hypothetical protein
MKLVFHPIAWAERAAAALLAGAVLLAGAMLLADAALVIVSAETMEQRLAASSFRMKPIPSGEHTIPTKGAEQ